MIAGHEAPTPEDFDYESPTHQDETPCCSKPADDLTTAEEASDLVQAIEASNAEEVKRQEYEALKAREEEWKRRGIAWNMNQARLNRRPGPLGATGKGARVKKQPERFGAAIPSETISPPKRRPQTGYKHPKFTLQTTPKPEKPERLPKDRKNKIVRAATPSPNNAGTGTSSSNTADQELTRLASHYTSQLDYMSVDEIRQQAGVETSEANTTGENLESSPEK